MAEFARQFRDLLLPLLIAAWGGVILVMGYVVVQRGVLRLLARRRARLRSLYVPAIRRAMASDGPESQPALLLLRTAPRRHRDVVAEALLEPLRVLQGLTVDRARSIATELGLAAQWRRSLTHGGWTRRANAALALGLLRDHDAVPDLVTLLDSDHHEVRAAAVDALGMIADAAAVQALLARIGQQSRHQQARLVEALRRIGPEVTESIVALDVQAPAERRLIAEILALVGGSGARARLIEWSSDADPTVRAAAWRAISVTGMDDRAAYYALRALGDGDPRVRAHAAQALGRVGRTDFVPYLATHLDDEWEVAAQGARALSRLGEPGLSALRAREASPAGGHGLELARHFLWERRR